jgi:PAS domain S-box-containing protein
VRDAEGRILGYEGTFVDITERKRAEEALRESEEKYRTLVERANDGICVIQDGIVKICNSRIPEYWGGSIEEIVGRGFQEFIHPDAMPLVMDWYNRRMRGESPPRVYNTILRRKDGSRSFVEVNAGIILYDGRPADLLILRDINERKKAEDELRKSEATIRALIDTPVDSLLLVDPEGIILEGNTTFAKRLGMTVEELKGRCVYDLPPPDLAKSRKSRIENIVRTGEPDRYEDQRAGLWFDNSLHPILDADGNVIKIAIIARDITDRRQMEEELRTCINRFGT